ncbi:hypothetical protein Mal64_30410 [Pseudobythopirellula maris]|uniref:Uncharacterized protein n=1 Tax=Pseudobythopirellula maris TaxID=2527991 RepID=A0A5C5ZL19_9BACT|nr:hypothetical protein Mal64_30410 [Pseudobythopirellula maris]
MPTILAHMTSLDWPAVLLAFAAGAACGATAVAARFRRS